MASFTSVARDRTLNVEKRVQRPLRGERKLQRRSWGELGRGCLGVQRRDRRGPGRGCLGLERTGGPGRARVFRGTVGDLFILEFQMLYTEMGRKPKSGISGSLDTIAGVQAPDLCPGS